VERRQSQNQGIRTRGKPQTALGQSRPILQLIGFYIVMVGGAALLTRYFPLVKEAWLNPAAGQPVPGGESFATGTNQVLQEGPLARSASTALIAFGALAISLPVAWVYTYTRRFRHDPSLVQSVVILPIVVAGIVTVVQHSVALAFSVAGIVAAVRFRNTLKDPKDAVYVFLALGIGIASGVRAMDIALVLSVVFNIVVLVLWKYNLGAVSSGTGGVSLLAIGDPSLLIANTNAQRDALRWRLAETAKDAETNGILIVHAEDPEAARRGLEVSLTQAAKNWQTVEGFRKRGGISTFAVLLELDKKTDPLALLGELDERWSDEIDAAEYIPYRTAPDKGKEKDKEKDKEKEKKE